MSTDAIVLLKKDHTEVKKLFRTYESTGKRAQATRGKLVNRILEQLTVHTYIENEVMYPEVRSLVPDLDDDVLESYEEHHLADVLCTELAALSPDNEHFHPKVTVLIEVVEHHIEEEEDEWFPQVREALGRKKLQEIGVRLEEARAKAPTSPAQPGALKQVVKGVLA
ncbi:MAG TPA: hemerythrin domain-containing protein [Mycobacteriales bacterium]